MRMGKGAEFFGINGSWEGFVSSATSYHTHSMRFGFAATPYSHLSWIPMIGIGVFDSVYTSGTGTLTEEPASLIWKEELDPCTSCGCSGNGLGYEITDTSANLWVR